jgi:flagellar secretion chaperone FliS
MNDKKNKVNAYKKTDVITANRETILLMMYAGAIRFLKGAIEAADGNNLEEKSRLINRTQEIITELRATLNFEAGGDIAGTLETLYTFISQRLMKSLSEKSTEPLKEALGILTTLNSAWEEAINNLRKGKSV